MKTIGIVAEFNPFHNGHKYLIDKAKSVTGADRVVIIMSGNYVQRGLPAIIDKYKRTRTALLCGADCVFELPVCFSTASAELFARSSICFLNKLGCIDYLCFGSESENISELRQIADILSNEPSFFKEKLNDYLRAGVSFPNARQKALSDYFSQKSIVLSNSLDSILSKSNNILAIEYLKALNYYNCAIKPIAISRQGEHYNSLSLDTAFASASGIRNGINNGLNVSKYIPQATSSIVSDCISNNLIIDLNDFSLILGERLCSHSNFNCFYGINEDLSNRISNKCIDYNGIYNFIESIVTKNLTYTHVTRALLHIILNIKKDDLDLFELQDYISFGRLLGFRKASADILSEIKKKSNIEIVSKYSTSFKNSSGLTKKMMEQNLYCDSLYRMICMSKSNIYIPTEFESQIVII